MMKQVAFRLLMKPLVVLLDWAVCDASCRCHKFDELLKALLNCERPLIRRKRWGTFGSCGYPPHGNIASVCIPKKNGLKIKPLLLGPLDSLDLGQNHRACLRRIPRLPATGQARQQDRPNGPCRENQGRWWRVVALPTAFSRPHPPLSWPWYGLVGRWPPQTTLPKLLSCQDV